MKYIDFLGKADSSGVCSKCGEHTYRERLVRILAEYTDEYGRSVIEPFTVCRQCHKELRKQ